MKLKFPPLPTSHTSPSHVSSNPAMLPRSSDSGTHLTSEKDIGQFPKSPHSHQLGSAVAKQLLKMFQKPETQTSASQLPTQADKTVATVDDTQAAENDLAKFWENLEGISGRKVGKATELREKELEKIHRIQNHIETLLGSLDCEYSFCAMLLHSGINSRIHSRKTIAINAEVKRPTASLVKAALAYVVMLYVKEGKLNLDETHIIQPGEPRWGEVNQLQVGQKLTYRQLVEEALQRSSNTAADILIKRIGLKEVNEALAEAEIETSLVKPIAELFREIWNRLESEKTKGKTDQEIFEMGFPDEKLYPVYEVMAKMDGEKEWWLGETDANDSTKLLARMHAGDLKEQGAQVIGIMKDQEYEMMLRAAPLPEGVELADKPGLWPYSTATDMGIILRQEAPPIAVTLLTTGNKSQDDLKKLDEVTAEIVQYLIANWK